MAIKPEEITRVLKEQIEGFNPETEMKEVGYVLQSGDGIARVYGLQNAVAGEMLQFPHDVFGIALNLEKESVGVVLLGEAAQIKEGDEVRRTGRIMDVPVGDALIGRVVNPLGQPIDGKGPIKTNKTRPVEAVAP